MNAITVTALLIHGKDETVVRYEQSEMLYEALHNANNVELGFAHYGAPLRHLRAWKKRA